MRVGVLSDSHDKLDRIVQAVDLLKAEGAQALFHCGDLLGGDALLLLADAGLPLYFVYGNNDLYYMKELQRIARETGVVCLGDGGMVTLAERRIAITHGHHTPTLKQLLAEKPDYCFVGHTHRRMDQREGGVRLINPGALHRVAEYSVALLDVKTDELRFLTL